MTEDDQALQFIWIQAFFTLELSTVLERARSEDSIERARSVR
jgi:hypothetical protein